MSLRALRAWLALCVAAASATAAAQAPRAVQTIVEGLHQDAAEYARRYQVSPQEALSRLLAQEQTVAVTEALGTEFAERLAGVSVEHRPAYRLVVLLTGTEPVPARNVRAGGLTVPIVFRTGAGATHQAIVAAIQSHQAAIRASLKVPPGMGVDPRTGELVVVASAADLAREGADALRSRLATLTGVPVRIQPQGREHRDLVAGGARVEGRTADGGRDACTTGFVVTDGVRRGVATAGHCPDILRYSDPEEGEVPLRFVGEWGGVSQDVQIHESSRAAHPLFFADPAQRSARTLLSWRSRKSTRAGDAVCHRGETSGYSCSEVELIDYAPPGDLCNGPCAPVWVTVRGPACKGGDSGGPVFSGAVAFGILKGASYAASGRCDFYYYMSTDFLPEGWTLLH